MTMLGLSQKWVAALTWMTMNIMLRLESIFVQTSIGLLRFQSAVFRYKLQESPAVADKPARRESMPKIASIPRAYMYNVVADNTGLSSFI